MTTANPSNQNTNPQGSYTRTISSAQPLRPIAPRMTPASSSFEGESTEGTQTIVCPDVKIPTYNHAHNTPTSTATQPLVPYAQSPQPNGTQHEHNSSPLPAYGGRAPQGPKVPRKRRHAMSHAVGSGDEFQPNGKRVRTARNNAGGSCRNSDTALTSIDSMPRATGIIQHAAIDPPMSSNRHFITNTSLPPSNTPPTTIKCSPPTEVHVCNFAPPSGTPASVGVSSANIPYSETVLGGGETATTCEGRIGVASLYGDFGSFATINSSLPFYHTPPATTPSVQLQYGNTPEQPSLGNHIPFPEHVQSINCTRHPHLRSTSRSGILLEMSPTSTPTAVAQLLQEGIAPKNLYPLQLFPEARVHQTDNSHLPPPIIQAGWPQVPGDNPPHPQQDRSGKDESCPHCSEIWLKHCECIFETSIDLKINGQHQLKSSFQELKKHIQEHWAASGTSCYICQDHFSNHLLALQLLPEVNLGHGEFRVELRQGVVAFREHVREKHTRS